MDSKFTQNRKGHRILKQLDKKDWGRIFNFKSYYSNQQGDYCGDRQKTQQTRPGSRQRPVQMEMGHF